MKSVALKTLAAACVAAMAITFAAPDAQAVTLTNRDSQKLRVIVSDWSGLTIEVLVLEPDLTIMDVCENGCTIAVEGGAKESFDGDEVVDIQEGEFVVVE